MIQKIISTGQSIVSTNIAITNIIPPQENHEIARWYTYQGEEGGKAVQDSYFCGVICYSQVSRYLVQYKGDKNQND